MSEIARYRMTPAITVRSDGEFVAHSDHLAAMREKDAEIERLNRAMDVPEDFDPNEQSWATVGSAVAWHLIDRHANSWGECGDMMEAWRDACGNARAERAEAQRDALLEALEVAATNLEYYRHEAAAVRARYSIKQIEQEKGA